MPSLSDLINTARKRATSAAGAAWDVPLTVGGAVAGQTLAAPWELAKYAELLPPELAQAGADRARALTAYRPETAGGKQAIADIADWMARNSGMAGAALQGMFPVQTASARWLADEAGQIPGAGRLAGGANALSQLVDPATALGSLKGLAAITPIAARAGKGATGAERFVAKAARSGELTPEEFDLLAGGKGHVNRGRATNFEEYRSAFDPEELAALARAGWAKRGWYQNSANALVDILGAEDAKRFALLLAATSPQTSVESNLRNTVNIWKNWKAANSPRDKESILKIMAQSVEGNKGEGSVLDAWRNNTYRALADKDPTDIMLSGPKVSSFAANLAKNMDEVTNDTWMARALGTSQDQIGGAQGAARDEISDLTGKNPAYIAGSAAQRRAAEILSQEIGQKVTPAEVQEMVWSALKTGWEKRAKTQGGNMSDILAHLDDAEVMSTPDFSTLLRDTPEYHDALAASGGNFTNISPHIDPGAPPPQDPVAFAKIAGKMEKRFRNETRPSALDFLIKNKKAVNVPPPTPMRVAGMDVQASPFEFSPAAQRQLGNVGMAPPTSLRMLEATPENRQLFVDTMTRRLQASKDPVMASVDIPSVDDLIGARLVLDEKGKAGMVVYPGGNIGNLWNTGGPSGMGTLGPALGVRLGGTHLDAFDTVLPRFYSQAGMRPVAALPWSEDVARESMGPDTLGEFKKRLENFNRGEPDLVFMTYNPKPKANTEVVGMGVDPYQFDAPFEYRSNRANLIEDVPQDPEYLSADPNTGYAAGKRAQRVANMRLLGGGPSDPWDTLGRFTTKRWAPVDPAPWQSDLSRFYPNADAQLDDILGTTPLYPTPPPPKRAKWKGQ